MDQLEKAHEIILNLRSDFLILESVSLQPHERNAFRFMGKFENGKHFDLVLCDKTEINNLKTVLQIKINDQYAEFSQFKVFATLQQDEKYTLVLTSELGMGVNALQFQYHSVRFGKYAQYLDSVELIFKVRRKRNLQGLRLYGNSAHKKEFILWKGWVTPDTNWMTNPEQGSVPEITIQRSKYSSFDPRYLTDALNSVKLAPLAHNLEGVQS